MASTIQRLFLIRHTTSAANLDPTLYLTTPDHVIPLATPDSDARAVQAAEALRGYELPVGDTCSWSSTYLRCRQTESLVTTQLFGANGSTALRRRSSFLLREQEFGDWDGLTDEEIAQRHPAHWEKKRRMSDQLGRFYFRFPNGESRADVVQRVTIFLGKMHRSRYQHHLIFLHGVTQRAFRMAWFDRGPEWFEAEPNPSNASVLMISRDTSGRWQEEFIYQLKGPHPRPLSRPRERGEAGRRCPLQESGSGGDSRSVRPHPASPWQGRRSRLAGARGTSVERRGQRFARDGMEGLTRPPLRRRGAGSRGTGRRRRGGYPCNAQAPQGHPRTSRPHLRTHSRSADIPPPLPT